MSAGAASAAAPRAAVGSVPSLPSAARITGSVSATRHVALTISLASRDPLAMQTMATAVSTPGSPVYRHYLSVAQFAERFGAPRSHIAAVSRALRAEGLHVGSVDANHLSLNVTGTAARVQSAFATRLARVRLSTGATAYADRRLPTLPASVASDVDAVVGLNTLVAPSPTRSPRARRHVGTSPDHGPRAMSSPAARSRARG